MVCCFLPDSFFASLPVRQGDQKEPALWVVIGWGSSGFLKRALAGLVPSTFFENIFGYSRGLV